MVAQARKSNRHQEERSSISPCRAWGLCANTVFKRESLVVKVHRASRAPRVMASFPTTRPQDADKPCAMSRLDASAERSRENYFTLPTQRCPLRCTVTTHVTSPRGAPGCSSSPFGPPFITPERLSCARFAAHPQGCIDLMVASVGLHWGYNCLIVQYRGNARHNSSMGCDVLLSCCPLSHPLLACPRKRTRQAVTQNRMFERPLLPGQSTANHTGLVVASLRRVGVRHRVIYDVRQDADILLSVCIWSAFQVHNMALPHHAPYASTDSTASMNKRVDLRQQAYEAH